MDNDKSKLITALVFTGAATVLIAQLLRKEHPDAAHFLEVAVAGGSSLIGLTVALKRQ